MMERDRPVRIANISGFYGDRVAAAREMLAGPEPIDVLTGDYLAELTMLLLWKAQRRNPEAGYATTFLRQMEETLGTCLDRGIRVVTNAGGLNPNGLARELTRLGEQLGLAPRIAVVEGDDLLDELADLQARTIDLAHLDTGQRLVDAGARPVTANAYLGGWGIAVGLAADADVVVTPRVTDAALVLGPAAWWHGWTASDLDALAGAVVAGHIIECGPQTTGGNYSFAADELPDDRYPGFPIAEVASNGTCVITKQPDTGGAVTVGTVTAQLLYEIGEPSYANPDVVARFDTIQLTQEGPDRVRVNGVRGESPPPNLKVAINFPKGWRNTMALVLTGLEQDDKARRALNMLTEILGGWEQFDDVDIRRVGSELRVTVKDTNRDKVGRRFSDAFMELLLASYAGAYTTTPPTDASEYGVYWPAAVPRDAVRHRVLLPDGSTHLVADGAPCDAEPIPYPMEIEAWVGGPTRAAPLGEVCGGRSGDKGGNANIGLWTRTDDSYRWLATEMTAARLRQLLPETAGLAIHRFELANLRALNFVIIGLLGEGVASSVRPDPQAKSLAEYLRAQAVEIPLELLEPA